VVTADVYAVPPHVGRGGWSWYTGSAGWMYRLLLESLLGVQRSANTLSLSPRLPANWNGYTLHYRHGAATYVIRVERAGQGAAAGLSVDGVPQQSSSIELRDVAATHQVTLTLG